MINNFLVQDKFISGILEIYIDTISDHLQLKNHIDGDDYIGRKKTWLRFRKQLNSQNVKLIWIVDH